MINILITGLSKSGTTLLMSLLDGHKDICVYPEEPYLRDIFLGRYKNWGEMITDFKGRNPVFSKKEIRYNIPFNIEGYIERFNELTSGCISSHYNLFDIIIGMFAAIPDRTYEEKYTAFKDTNFFSLDKWFSIFPESKVIVISRDLMGNYSSVIRSGDQGRGLKQLIKFVAWWYKGGNYFKKAQEDYGKERVCIINYETLVIYKSPEIKSIYNFLDINYDEIFLKPTCLGQEIEVNTATCDKGDSIYKSSAFRWKKDLKLWEKILLGIFLRNEWMMRWLVKGKNVWGVIRSTTNRL